MNIAMTGATGFVGRGLKTELERLGHSVFPIGRGISAVTLAESLSSWKIDVVVHLASLFIAEHKPEQVAPLIESNILFGTELLEAMRIANVGRLVNAGTTWQTYHTSHDDYRPVCLYAATKQAFEDIISFYVDAYAMRAITLRIFDTYGPKDPRPKLVPKLFEAARLKTKLEMSPGEQLIDLLYVDDLNAAFVAAIEQTKDASPGHQHFGLPSGSRVSLKELVALIGKTSGSEVNVTWGARPYRAREVMKPTTDYPTLKGWKPKVSLEAGLRKLWDANV
jgi:nucleoside-diphosphate-sugar epimerase